MNHHINPSKAGLAVGTFMGLLHLVWAVLVAFGWAQSLANFSMWAHMIKVSYAVQSFDFGTAVILVIMTAVAGYVIGFVFARIWNRTHRG